MQESKNFCDNILAKFSIDLDGIFCTVETYWRDKPHTHFVLFIQFSKGRTILM